MVRLPNMRLLSASGIYDTVTPFYAAQFVLEQGFEKVISNPKTGATLNLHDRMEIMHYPSGHMVYTNPIARIQFKKDLVDFYGKSLDQPQPPTLVDVPDSN